MVWCGMLLWYGMLVWYNVSMLWYMLCYYRIFLGMMLVLEGMVWYVIVCQYGMMLVSQGIVGYDMVYYTCMHDLEVETHINLV